MDRRSSSAPSVMELPILDAKQSGGEGAPSLNRSQGQTPVGGLKPRKRVGKALKPVVIAFAVLYFLIDALFFALIKPFATWLSKLRNLQKLSGNPIDLAAAFVVRPSAPDSFADGEGHTQAPVWSMRPWQCVA